MTFYGIYLIRRKDESLIELPNLFAFTNKKDIYEDFISQRDMSKFYTKKKEITKELYQKFVKMNKSLELSYQELYTRNEFDPMKKTKIKVLSTWKEIESVVLKGDMIFKELTKYITPSIYTLKESWLLSLTNIGYMNVCRFVGQSFSYEISPLFDGICNGEYYEEPDIDYDEFALFMHFYGYTFK